MPGEPDPFWEDGMRSLHADEMEGIFALTSAVFRPTLVAEYPPFSKTRCVRAERMAWISCSYRDIGRCITDSVADMWGWTGDSK